MTTTLTPTEYATTTREICDFAGAQIFARGERVIITSRNPAGQLQIRGVNCARSAWVFPATLEPSGEINT